MDIVNGNTELSLSRKCILFILITLIEITLVRYAEILKPSGPYPGIFLAITVIIAFGLWFGLWGVIAAFIAGFIGAGIPLGLPLPMNLLFSFSDAIQALIPLLAFRLLNADESLSSLRDVGIYLVFGWLLANIAGGLWGTFSVVAAGVIPMQQAQSFFTSWVLGNLFVTFLVTTVLLIFISPYIREHGLYIRYL
jgi:hypothetical protein